MRAYKSYLAAHSSWAQHDPALCPKWEEVDENFEQAIIYCPTTKPSRELYIPDISSLDLESPLCLDNMKLTPLAEFIKATKTGYPLHGAATCKPSHPQAPQIS
jgi:hypothetical protein